MNKKTVLDATVKYVKKVMGEESTGHDWWHAYRVWKLSLRIARKEENVDLFVVQLGALLHDITDWKFHDGSPNIEERTIRPLLKRIGADDETISKTIEIVKNVSFKGAGVADKMKNIEGKIVQDADRLDAIGAMSIARCFAYGGKKNRSIYNPEIKPQYHKDFLRTRIQILLR